MGWFGFRLGKKIVGSSGKSISLASSEEALSDLRVAGTEALRVHALYRTAFGRAPDAAGLAGYSKRLGKGVSITLLADEIANSEEFQMLRGQGRQIDRDFISALYRDGLGRQPTLEEYFHWLVKGLGGARRSELLAAVSDSKELEEKLRSFNLTEAEKYIRWATKQDTIGNFDRLAIRTHLSGLPFRPLISIILFAEATSAESLRRSIDSVKCQLYQNWELLIVFNSTLSKNCLKEHGTAIDSRIRIISSEKLEVLAESVNTALQLTTGPFTAFLHGGDALPEHALYEIAVELGTTPEATILYTDRDEIDIRGLRSNPWFKPGWDPDLLLANNYFNDFTVYRFELLKEIGYLRTGLREQNYTIWLYERQRRRGRILFGIFRQSYIIKRRTLQKGQVDPKLGVQRLAAQFVTTLIRSI